MDAGPDAVDGAVDAESRDDSGPVSDSCFAPFAQLPDCEDFSRSSLPQATRTGVLLRATDFGTNVQFRSLGQLAVAASRSVGGVEEPFVVRLTHPLSEEPTSARVLELAWPPDVGGIELRAVWGAMTPLSALGADVFALACRAQADCAVLAADSDTDATLQPLWGDVEDAAPQGLVAWHDSLCVFGSGIRCHDGTGWTQHVDDDATRPLRAMVVAGSLAVAVGDGGRVLLDEGTGFQAASTGSADDLRFAAAEGATVYAGSEGGLWRGGPTGPWNLCSHDSLVFAELWLSPDPMPGALMVDSAGRIVQYAWNVHSQSLEYCAYSDLGLEEGSLLTGGLAPCAEASNPMVLSASTLWVAAGKSLNCFYARLNQ